MFQWVKLLFVVSFIGLLSGMPTSTSLGQEEKKQEKRVLSDMELVEHVAFLQRELESPEIPKRDAAEKELIELGVRVLDYLEPVTEKTPSDAVARIGNVRKVL